MEYGNINVKILIKFFIISFITSDEISYTSKFAVML
jgi:hypothetical protein